MKTLLSCYYESAVIAPAVERVIGNDEVTGSNPVDGTILT